MLNKKRHSSLKKKALSNKIVKAEYAALAEEFELIKEMLKARNRSGMTQSEVAEIMHTSTSVIGRLEAVHEGRRHSPTLATLRRYAKAVGCELQIKLVPQRKRV